MPPYMPFNKGTNPPKNKMKNNTPRKLTLETFFVSTSLFFFSTLVLLFGANASAMISTLEWELVALEILVGSSYNMVYMTSMEEDRD